jgi:hypothetical protein
MITIEPITVRLNDGTNMPPPADLPVASPTEQTVTLAKKEAMETNIAKEQAASATTSPTEQTAAMAAAKEAMETTIAKEQAAASATISPTEQTTTLATQQAIKDAITKLQLQAAAQTTALKTTTEPATTAPTTGQTAQMAQMENDATAQAAAEATKLKMTSALMNIQSAQIISTQPALINGSTVHELSGLLSMAGL